MKKLTLMAFALLTLGATAAMAQDTMNLGYVCRTAANTSAAATNDFNTSAVGPCDDGASYTTIKRILSSFKNATSMTDWAGTSVAIDIATATTPLPDFWAIQPSGCRDGAMAIPTVMSTSGATGCTNPFVLAPTDPAGQGETNGITADVATGRVRIKSFHIRASVGVNLPPPASAGGYIANNFALAPDGADVCAGCADPACIVLNQVEYYSGNENRQIHQPELRNYLIWNGGSPNCPGATPTKSSTWGQVKALYR